MKIGLRSVVHRSYKVLKCLMNLSILVVFTYFASMALLLLSQAVSSYEFQDKAWSVIMAMHLVTAQVTTVSSPRDTFETNEEKLAIVAVTITGICISLVFVNQTRKYFEDF